MKGLILAAGRGSRLAPISHTLPKQLVSLANKPVIEYIVEDLVAVGIHEIGIVVSEVDTQIREHFEDGSEFGADISYIVQPDPLGPANAVSHAEEFIGDSSFLLYFGDTFVDRTITEQLVDSFNPAKQSIGLSFQEVDEPSRYGIAEFDGDDNITAVHEKPSNPPSNLAYIGVVAFSPHVFDIIGSQGVAETGEIEITDTIDRLVRSDSGVQWHVEEGTWRDVGTPIDVVETNSHILNSINHSIDGTIQEDASVEGTVDLGSRSVIEAGATVHGPVSISEDVRIKSGTTVGPYVSVGPDCTIENARIESSVLLSGVNITNTHITQSLIGRQTEIEGKEQTDSTPMQLVVGDDTQIQR